MIPGKWQNSFLLDAPYREKCNRVTKKWYQNPQKDFIHMCGIMGDDKALAGWCDLEKKECTCCGTDIPEQVMMLASLQKIEGE
jgi:hypothetical protein